MPATSPNTPKGNSWHLTPPNHHKQPLSCSGFCRSEIPAESPGAMCTGSLTKSHSHGHILQFGSTCRVQLRNLVSKKPESGQSSSIQNPAGQRCKALPNSSVIAALLLAQIQAHAGPDLLPVYRPWGGLCTGPMLLPICLWQGTMSDKTPSRLNRNPNLPLCMTKEA